MNSVSIVIRTLNEKDSLIHLLEILGSQNFLGEKEIIVVDNESSDGTIEVAQKAGAKIVTIKKHDFSYPRSMNLGVEHAQYPVVILLVGHAFPVSKNWINAVVEHFEDPQVAGVYSPTIPSMPYGLSECLLYFPRFILDRRRSPFVMKKVRMGVFGATNIAIRKTIWDKNKFEEKYEMGGEDTQWAGWAIKHGYKIICDTEFVVRHSHRLGLWGVIQQVKYWRELSKPAKFSKKKLFFRKDLKF